MLVGKTVKNYIYNLIYQLLVLMVPIILSPYLARVLGADNLGIYSYISSCVSLLSTIVLLGTYSYGSRQIAYTRDNLIESNVVFWNVTLIRLILGIIGIVVFGIIAATSDCFTYFMLYLPWLIASIIDVSWLFIGMEDMRPTALKNAFIKIASVILIFTFVKSTSDLWKYIFLMAASTLIANFALLIQCKKYIKKFKLCILQWKSILKDSIMLFLPQVAVLLYLQVDKIMLKELTLEASQVAFYDQAEKIVTIPLTFITILSTVIMPKIANSYAKDNRDEIKRVIMNVARYSLFAAVPMMFGIASVAKGLIPWYLGNDFLPVGTAIKILAPIVVLNSLIGISGNQYFTATNQLKVLLFSNVIAAVVNICLNAIFIPKFQYAGAAIATVVSAVVSIIIQYTVLGRQMNIKPIAISFVKYAALSIPMILVVSIISRKMTVSPMTTFMEIAIGGIVYVLMCSVVRDEVFFSVMGIVLNIFRKGK